jgi:hypothetical protein
MAQKRFYLSVREKILAIELLMVDMRMSWGRSIFGYTVEFRGRFLGFCETRKRRRIALKLAASLSDYVHDDEMWQLMSLYLHRIIGRLYVFRPGQDGRWFRGGFPEGGYEGMVLIHRTHVRTDTYQNGRTNSRYCWTDCSPKLQRLLKRSLKLPLHYYFYNYDKD